MAHNAMQYVALPAPTALPGGPSFPSLYHHSPNCPLANHPNPAATIRDLTPRDIYFSNSSKASFINSWGSNQAKFQHPFQQPCTNLPLSLPVSHSLLAGVIFQVKASLIYGKVRMF